MPVSSTPGLSDLAVAELDKGIKRIAGHASQRPLEPGRPFHMRGLRDLVDEGLYAPQSQYSFVDKEDFLEILGFRVIHAPQSSRILHNLGMYR